MLLNILRIYRDLPRAILRRYLHRCNKLIYLSIYLRNGSLYARARASASAHLLHYVSRERVLYFGVATHERVKLPPCALYLRVGPPRHCMLRPFATRGVVATGTMFPRRTTTRTFASNTSNVSVGRFTEGKGLRALAKQPGKGRLQSFSLESTRGLLRIARNR